MATRSSIKFISEYNDPIYIYSQYNGYIYGMASKLLDAFTIKHTKNEFLMGRNINIVNAFIAADIDNCKIISPNDFGNMIESYLYVIDIDKMTIKVNDSNETKKLNDFINDAFVLEDYEKVIFETRIGKFVTKDSIKQCLASLNETIKMFKDNSNPNKIMCNDIIEDLEKIIKQYNIE